MATHLKVANKQIDAIIAVPLHPKRMQERGFNQSDLIAEHINQQLELPDYSKCLTRIINTANQTSLKASERKKNIKNAFHCQPLEAIKTVAIIDDVVTTGATADEIARTLKDRGVERVEV